MLLVPRTSKFATRALEGDILKTLEHGVFRTVEVLDHVYNIIKSGHIKCNKFLFSGVSDLAVVMDNEILADESVLDLGISNNKSPTA